MIDTIEGVTGRTIRLLSFYSNDEFDIDQLLGMRYKLEFLDRRLTSETGYGGARTYGGNLHSAYGRQKFHGFPSKFLWTAGLTAPERATATPYMARGSGVEVASDTISPIPSPTLGLKLGYRWDTTGSPFRKYEADVKTPYYGTYTKISLPFPTSPDYTTLPAYESMIHSNNAEVGPSGMQENAAYVNMYQTGNWYFAKRRYYWTNFFYHTDPKFGFDSSGRPYAQYRKFQPLTGEAVRLGHGTALNLGTRGFMYDKWYYPRDTTDTIVHPDSVPNDPGSTFSRDAYFPGYVTEHDSTINWDASSSVIIDTLLQSELLGGDYYATVDRINIHDWAPLGTLAAEMQLNRFMNGDSSKKVYAGRISVRMESKWWHDLVTDTDTIFKHDTDQSNATLFMKTRPVAWFGKGFRNLTNGDTIKLRKWVDAFADSLKVSRWTRTSSSDTTLKLEPEPLAEQLYDVVLMDTSEVGSANDNCVLAITNRRTSPFLFNTSLPDSIEWISTYEHDTLTRNSRPDLRYKQVGARRITIPFNYKVETTKPYLLHVRELRPAYDSEYTIDTILNWNSDLVVDFRPGDTRYFRIKRLDAIDSLNTGYLAFSTQNKLIAYPVAKSDNSGYTDSIRYHMVFHRRDEDPNRTGPWTVFYQRSIPYHRDSLPLVAGLHWEPAIRLSKITTNSISKTDGLKRTLFNGDVDSTEYLASVTANSDATLDCSCGFPSIVVRDSASNKPKIFVVYACEDEWANAQKNLYFHIVENSFLDKTLLEPLILEANGKSLVIAKKNIGHDGGVDTLKSLAAFGTPVINASAFNRMYYAWSSSGAGIGAGLKTSAQDWFPAANAITNIASPTITWYYNHVVDTTHVVDTIPIDGGTPRYPSLNVYSNIAQNRSDATLVWQEGTTNPHIRYTRLILGGGTAIARMLPAFVEMSYDAGTPPSIPKDVTHAIAIVGGASLNEDAELPVVVRSLQQDTMSMFIRDADGSPNGTYKYNHETVAWSEWLTSEVRSRVRYNHFIDMQGFPAQSAQLHYWWANTTSGLGGVSLFHPVITNGAVRLDSLTWQGVVDDTLITYDDSLHIVKGNLSDSAIIVNYSVMNNGSYLNLRAQKVAGYASYWTGHAYFTSLLGQQIMIRRMPGIPAPIVPIYHYDFLRADGAWPHVSMRLRENFPNGIQSVRRVLQYTNTNAPSLFASAEQFYKEFEDGDRTEPATYGGFEVAGDKVLSRAILDNGQSVSFLPVYSADIPEGFVGSDEYAWQMSSMTTPVSELVSDVFSVGDVATLKILSYGTLRKDIELTIEEVNPETISKDASGTSKFSSLAESNEKTAVDFAEADKDNSEKTELVTYYLTNGGDALYRLRMKYTGGNPVVFREDVDIDPEEESFEKPTSKPIQIIDLKYHKKVEIAASSELSIYPNPSVDRVTIIISGINVTSDIKQNLLPYLDVCDAMGRVVITSPVQYGEAIDIVGLPTGVYFARVRLEGRLGMEIQACGSFSIVN